MNRLFVGKKMTRKFFSRRTGLALVGWLVVATMAMAQQFPYTAYVTGEQAYVRSGPGQKYYPTSQAPAGFAVEVYRHESQGWCAIRPPLGSFCWVPSHQVRQVEAGVAEIVGDRVIARIGSSLSPGRSAVQVLLPQGERVELLPPDEEDDPRWVRVAAPAGEFRWIAAKDLSRQPPLESTPLPTAPPSAWTQQPKPLPNDERADNFDHLKQPESINRGGLQFGTARPLPPNQPPRPAPLEPNALDIVAGSPAELQLMQFQTQSATMTTPTLLGSNGAAAMPTVSGEPTSQPRVRFHGLTAATPTMVGSVEELELRLSQAVVQPPQQWELDPLETAANSLLASTKTPSVRSQLREVLDRITRFQQVQQRYSDPATTTVAERDPFAAPGELGGELDVNSGLTGLSSSIRQRVQQDFASDASAKVEGPSAAAKKPLYDATGLLKPVVSKREQAPQYALVDERGKVVSFVTPTPDLNLKPYVGRRIGVHGTRGFMPEYKRAHVTAGRVTPLEGTVRR